MAKYRRDRINDSVAEEAAQIVREIKDPRVSGAMITVTGADVTADLKFAKIYYSVLLPGEDEEKRKEIARGLKSAASFMRSQLAHRLNLRLTPEITFVEDHGVEHGAKIAAFLRTIHPMEDHPMEGHPMEDHPMEDHPTVTSPEEAGNDSSHGKGTGDGGHEE